MTTKDEVIDSLQRTLRMARDGYIALGSDSTAPRVQLIDKTLRETAAALALPPQVSVTEAMVEAGYQAAMDVLESGSNVLSEDADGDPDLYAEFHKAMRAALQAALSAVPAGGDGGCQTCGDHRQVLDIPCPNCAPSEPSDGELREILAEVLKAEGASVEVDWNFTPAQWERAFMAAMREAARRARTP